MVRRCGLDETSDIARTRRLQWSGHVRRRGEREPLTVVRSWQVEGHCPKGRSKKSWMKTIEGDMRLLGLNEALDSDHQRWREAVNRATPQSGNLRR